MTIDDPGNISQREGAPPAEGAWDKRIRQVADIPWGVVVLIVLVVLAATRLLPSSDDLRAFAAAAGLLGVGHGIHTGAKSFAKRQDK